MPSLKIDTFMPREDLADFFRRLAHALETGEGGELACAREFKKIKISLKDEYGQVSLRARVKSASECQAEEPDSLPSETLHTPPAPAKPKYKFLKKRMGSSFKVLFKMIHQGKMPPAAAVEEFLNDSRIMVSYPGYGDPAYDAYMAACDEFAAAYESGDLKRLNMTVDTLVHQKGHCHAKYK
ncbi:GAK system XXXCH domain-containing protein [Pseudodesulfovibrio piezophilus]|uniref:GAK system XXXCH domain-containing protein n=1 Tax=Pseudodesulfovibrio piezophilus (strain DSM 21447 / JCM 15486 / C1TLV30) TaxID=1322246 RepID=M1WMV1_PSEP2|nr:GAK system XXXCH domain-containing protein [Pseudodesulfovibrio piezophilus]CCH49985.1 conserved protein of unknown function [Pseudodesulfovibrio piezophilus C1TLV30]